MIVDLILVLLAAFTLARILIYFAMWSGSASAEAYFEVMGREQNMTREAVWARSHPFYKAMVRRERYNREIVK